MSNAQRAQALYVLANPTLFAHRPFVLSIARSWLTGRPVIFLRKAGNAARLSDQ